MHPQQGAEEISMKHGKRLDSSLMMWKAVWSGWQELTEPTGKIHHLQLCVEFWFWSAHASCVFQIHWYMTQTFPFSFVSLLRNAEHRVKNQQKQGILSKCENSDTGR